MAAPPRGTGERTLAGALGEGPAAPGAGEHLLGRTVLRGQRGDLEVRLVAAVSADTVHPRGLGDEPCPRSPPLPAEPPGDRKSKRLNSSHMSNSYAVFCL